MNIIFFEKQRIDELQNALRDISCDAFSSAKTAFENTVAAMNAEFYSMGNITQLINDIHNELAILEEAFYDNISFLEILDDKYSAVEQANWRTLEALMDGLAIYDGTKESGEIIPDISVTINRTLRYLLSNLIEGYEEQIKPIQLKDYVINHNGEYFVSEISEKSIVNKYLTKLDFKFLSSLSQVYDFFDFSDINVVILNDTETTDKLNQDTDFGSEPQNIAAQGNVFPGAPLHFSEVSDNQLLNSSKINPDREKILPEIEQPLISPGVNDTETRKNLDSDNSAYFGDTILAASAAGIAMRAFEGDEDNKLNSAVIINNNLSKSDKEASSEPEYVIHTQRRLRRTTENWEDDLSDYVEIKDISPANVRITQKNIINPDEDIEINDIAAKPSTVSSREIASGVDTEVDNIATSSAAASREIASGVDTAVYNIAASSRETASGVDTAVDNIPVDNTVISQKQTNALDENMVSPANVTVTPKYIITPDGDTTLHSIQVTTIPTTKKHVITPDGDTTLYDISIEDDKLTEKFESDNYASATLNLNEQIRVITDKYGTFPSENASLNNIMVSSTVMSIQAALAPADEAMSMLNLRSLKSETSFGKGSQNSDSERTFRAINKFSLVKDEEDEKIDYINVNRAAKSDTETIKEDDSAGEISSLSNVTQTRDITPYEFIEGVADELQLVEVAIRKTLNWEEEEFYEFMDFVYALAYTTEFSSTQMIIPDVYSAIMSYIVTNAFKKNDVQSNTPAEESVPHLKAYKEYQSTPDVTVNPALINESLRHEAALIILDTVKNNKTARALAAMNYPLDLMSANDIFAGEAEIFNAASQRFGSQGGGPAYIEYDTLVSPKLLSAHLSDARENLLEQEIKHFALQAAANNVVSSFVGVAPSQRVTIHSVMPAFTTFDRPKDPKLAQASDDGARVEKKDLKKNSKKVEQLLSQEDDLRDRYINVRHSNLFPQNKAEDFDVEYASSDDSLSQYTVDVTGGGFAGFLGGLILAGEKEISEEFLRISKLPCHTYEAVIKNAYESGIIKYAQRMVEAGDIFKVLSGGKATVTTLEHIESCLT